MVQRSSMIDPQSSATENQSAEAPTLIRDRVLNECVEAFELAWSAGCPPDIVAHLPPEPATRRVVLFELIYVEMEWRFKKGEFPTPEEYVERFPELSPDDVAWEEVVAFQKQMSVRNKNQFAEASDSFGANSHTKSDPFKRDSATQYGELLEAVAEGRDDSDRYTRLSEIAQGGLGAIWRVRDQCVRRDVAYKEMLPKTVHDPRLLERFVLEAQVTGQLEHPSIIPIYDVGWQSDGTPFYAMKLVRGVTFKDAIHEYHQLPRESPQRRLRFRLLLQQFIAVCQAMAFAHERGVLHRDLKPQNVMLGDFGETLVLDWGLAKILGESESSSDMATADGEVSKDSKTGLSGRPSISTTARKGGTETMVGSVMGTPTYMPPEQALGQLKELDARSDIYSLGAILYHLLTNQSPIARDAISTMLKNVIDGSIVPMRSASKDVPPSLEAVCRKCLAKNKIDRYANAKLLAEDVECFLADEPVSVYREPWFTRLRRWGRRHRTAVMTTAASVLVALTAFGLASALEQSLRSAFVKEVQSRLTQFRTDADVARFYSCQFTVDRDRPQGEKAIRAAQSALQRYGLETPDGNRKALENLSKTDVKEVWQRAIELCVILAESERLAASDQVGGEQAATWKRALVWLELARTYAPETSSAVWHLEAEIRQAQGDSAAAEQARATANNTKPAEAWELFALAEIERRNHSRFLKSAALYEQALVRDPTHFLSAYFLGVAHLQEALARGQDSVETDGQLAAAQAAFTLCLAQRPDFPWSRLLRGLTLAYRGQFDAALAELQTAATLDTTHDQRTLFDAEYFQYALALNRGAVRLLNSQHAQAEADFRMALSLRPDSIAPRRNLARSFLARKQYAAAAKILDEAIRLAERDAELWRDRAEVYVHLNRPVDALRDFSNAIERAETPRLRAECQAAVADIYRAQAKWPEALSACDLALELQPAEPRYHRLRGEILLGLDRPAEAVSEFSQYIGKTLPKPSDVEQLRNLLDAYRARGTASQQSEGADLRQTLQDFTRVLELEQVTERERSANILYSRGLLMLLNNLELAERDFEESIKLNPQDGRSYFGRGYVRVQKGDLAGAFQDAERAVELGPRVWQMFYDPATI